MAATSSMRLPQRVLRNESPRVRERVVPEHLETGGDETLREYAELVGCHGERGMGLP
ncbi:MAG: hypothetical protein ACR2MK_08770 [Solirubrobacteraceae bacterium]